MYNGRCYTELKDVKVGKYGIKMEFYRIGLIATRSILGLEWGEFMENVGECWLILSSRIL